MTKKHLPIYGVGPYLISSIVLITVFAMISTSLKIIPYYNINQINTFLIIFGTLLIVIGIVFWLLAVIKSRISNSVKNNDLVTTGIYGIYNASDICCFFVYINWDDSNIWKYIIIHPPHYLLGIINRNHEKNVRSMVNRFIR